MVMQLQQLRIGLWGSPGAGKTTYLAALQIASLQDPGQWMIVGQDQDLSDSNKFLAQSTNMLQVDRQFPEQSQALTHFAYRVTGHATEQHLADILDPRVEDAIRRHEIDLLDFRLDLFDQPGGFFSTVFDYQDELWQNLAQCDGLVYLYDLTQPKLSFTALNLALPILALACQEASGGSRLLPNSRKLPHFLAVCGVKYDAPDVFNKLRQDGLIVIDARTGRAVPRVTNPGMLFRLFPDGLTERFLAAFFDSARTHFFSTSAIGFHSDDPRRIDLNDAFNTVDTPAGPRIRGDIHPVNIFTPLVWLASRLRLQNRVTP